MNNDNTNNNSNNKDNTINPNGIGFTGVPGQPQASGSQPSSLPPPPSPFDPSLYHIPNAPRSGPAPTPQYAPPTPRNLDDASTSDNGAPPPIFSFSRRSAPSISSTGTLPTSSITSIMSQSQSQSQPFGIGIIKPQASTLTAGQQQPPPSSITTPTATSSGSQSASLPPPPSPYTPSVYNNMPPTPVPGPAATPIGAAPTPRNLDESVTHSDDGMQVMPMGNGKGGISMVQQQQQMQNNFMQQQQQPNQFASFISQQMINAFGNNGLNGSFIPLGGISNFPTIQTHNPQTQQQQSHQSHQQPSTNATASSSTSISSSSSSSSSSSNPTMIISVEPSMSLITNNSTATTTNKIGKNSAADNAKRHSQRGGDASGSRHGHHGHHGHSHSHKKDIEKKNSLTAAGADMPAKMGSKRKDEDTTNTTNKEGGGNGGKEGRHGSKRKKEHRRRHRKHRSSRRSKKYDDDDDDDDDEDSSSTSDSDRDEESWSSDSSDSSDDNSSSSSSDDDDDDDGSVLDKKKMKLMLLKVFKSDFGKTLLGMNTTLSTLQQTQSSQQTTTTTTPSSSTSSKNKRRKGEKGKDGKTESPYIYLKFAGSDGPNFFMEGDVATLGRGKGCQFRIAERSLKSKLLTITRRSAREIYVVPSNDQPISVDEARVTSSICRVRWGQKISFSTEKLFSFILVASTRLFTEEELSPSYEDFYAANKKYILEEPAEAMEVEKEKEKEEKKEEKEKEKVEVLSAADRKAALARCDALLDHQGPIKDTKWLQDFRREATKLGMSTLEIETRASAALDRLKARTAEAKNRANTEKDPIKSIKWPLTYYFGEMADALRLKEDASSSGSSAQNEQNHTPAPAPAPTPASSTIIVSDDEGGEGGERGGDERHKKGEEEREKREADGAPIETFFSTVKGHLKDVFRRNIIPSETITESFESFSYYLNKTVQQLLVNSAYLYLARPEFAHIAAGLKTLTRTVLMCAPEGTELYQEALGKALAKHFDASVLTIGRDDFTHNVVKFVGGRAVLRCRPYGNAGSSINVYWSPADDDNGLDEDEEKELLSASLSSSNININSGGSGTLNVGDRVVYNRSSTTLGMHPDKSRTKDGPEDGAHGTVVLTFPTCRRIGVQFDKAFPLGSTLGGFSKEGSGAFVDSRHLEREDSRTCTEQLVLDAVGDVLAERPGRPTVVLVKEPIALFEQSATLPARLKQLIDRVESEGLPVVFLALNSNKDWEKYKSAIAASSAGGAAGSPQGAGSGTAAVSHSMAFGPSLIGNAMAAAAAAAMGGTSLPIKGAPQPPGAALFGDSGNPGKGICLGGRIPFLEQAAAGGGRGKRGELGRNTQEERFRWLAQLFPTSIEIKAPTDSSELARWRERIVDDTFKIQLSANKETLEKVQDKLSVQVVGDIGTIPEMNSILFTPDEMSQILAHAISDHLQKTSTMTTLPTLPTLSTDKPQSSPPPPPTSTTTTTCESTTTITDTMEFTPSKPKKKASRMSSPLTAHTITGSVPPPESAKKGLQVPLESFVVGLGILTNSKPDKARSLISKASISNDYERNILADVITPEESNVRFSDVGALEDVKKTLYETVMLPLQRPELFRRGNLAKPTKGILLFGPPGTGKTLIARAIATESGANFISVTPSSVTSKYVGDSNKLIKAVFSLAAKLAPTVIFIDEVDSLLSTRSSPHEHDVTRKIKNEFMACWDGLRTSQTERVIVLAATNRPMDLDDAVLRRLSRRILVDLPDTPNREKILRIILKDEDLEDDFDYAELARKTAGYSGSDLKNLCIAAAQRPLREFLQKEKEEEEEEEEEKEKMEEEGEEEEGEGEKEKEKEKKKKAGKEGEEASSKMELDPPSPTGKLCWKKTKDECKTLRKLNMKDFEESIPKVGKSVSENAPSLNALRTWNQEFGDGNKASFTHYSYYN